MEAPPNLMKLILSIGAIDNVNRCLGVNYLHGTH